MASRLSRSIARWLMLAAITSLLLSVGAIDLNAQWVWWGSTWQATYEYAPGNSDVGRGIVMLGDNTHCAAGETISANGTDIYVVRTGVCYNTIWAYTYDFGGRDLTARIRATADGGFIIVGTSENVLVGPCPGHNNIFLLKIDAAGAVQWGRLYGGDELEAGYDVQVLADGYIIAGETNSFGFGGRDAYLIKTDLNGIPVWNKVYGGANDDSFRSCVAAANGDIVAVGETFSFSTPGNGDIFFVRVAGANGNLIGVPKHYDGPGHQNDIAYSALEDVGGGSIVMVGGTQSYGNASEAFILRTDPAGVFWNYAVYGGPNVGWDEFRDITYVPQGHYAVTGPFEDIPGGWGNIDVYVGILDGAFTIVSDVLHGGNQDDAGWGISTVFGAPIAVAGGTRSLALSQEDMYLIRQDVNGFAGCEDPDPEIPLVSTYLIQDDARFQPFSVGNYCERNPTRGPRQTTENPFCTNCIIYPLDNVSGSNPAGTSPAFANPGESERISAVDATGIEALGELKLYPNPITSDRLLVLEHRPVPGAELTLTVSDMAGKIVSNSRRSMSEGRLEIHTEGWPTGTYVLRMMIGNRTETRQVTVLDN